MKTQSPLISVIIVNWNGGAVLQQCLQSVFSQTFQDFEVILVDNASMDNSLDGVERHWPSVNIIRMETNTGFAVANNVAAHAANGQWLALLNGDAFPEPGWLKALVDASVNHPDLFFFTSCLIQANNPDKLDGTGDQYNIGGVAWSRQNGEPVELAMQTIDEVFSSCGAAAFYPKSIFLEAGGFDETFFSYLEDVDLGFRLRLLGYTCLYVPQARVLHIGSASLGRESKFAIYHTLRNMAWIFFKNMPAPYFWKYLPIHIVMNLGYSLYYALCCCPLISLRATKDSLLGIPNVLRARKKIQVSLRVDPQDVVRVIRNPLHGRISPLVILMFLPKLVTKFILAVKQCRTRRRRTNQAKELEGTSKS